MDELKRFYDERIKTNGSNKRLMRDFESLLPEERSFLEHSFSFEAWLLGQRRDELFKTIMDALTPILMPPLEWLEKILPK